MKKIFMLSSLIFLFSLQMKAQEKQMVTLREIPGENKVEVRINGELFTAYIFPETMEKPVLYPINSPGGNPVTRGFPIDPRPNERVDHPHHVGHWLNYGNVNGLDFWNNSFAIPEESKPKYGWIVHEKVICTQSGEGKGVLEVVCSWQNYLGEELLKEHTSFIFFAGENTRSIERISTLSASDKTVHFKDNKEGLFAIRMDRAFEFPTDRPMIFTDSRGKPTQVKMVNNQGANGEYLSSEGASGADVWGTRAEWMRLSAKKADENLSVVIFDHPENPGFPTYWHARTYGLFSANPLGQSVFSKGKEEMNFILEPEESVTFRYKIHIHSGKTPSQADLDKIEKDFSKKS